MFAFVLTTLFHTTTVLTFDDLSLSKFKSWALSDTNRPTGNRDFFLGYDGSFDIDSIWIIGGTQDSNAVYRYSISNDTIFSVYPTLTSDSNRWTRGKPGFIMYNDVVYFITSDGDFRIYNTTTHTETTIVETGLYLPC